MSLTKIEKQIPNFQELFNQWDRLNEQTKLWLPLKGAALKAHFLSNWPMWELGNRCLTWRFSLAVEKCGPFSSFALRSLILSLDRLQSLEHLSFLWLYQWWLSYSRVHKSSDSFFSKILEKPSIVQKKMIPHIKWLDFSQRWSKKKFKMADLENSKWPPQKNLVFQLRQFSIFFNENFMDWSLG